MLTLAQVAQRVNDILKESPSKANQPVFLRIKRSKRTTEYVPVMYVCGGTLGIGDLNVTEFTADTTRSFTLPPRKGKKAS